MCLITFSWNPESSTPLLLSANRDEFHHRPTAYAQYWPEQPHIFAGKDLQAGGTWLGVNRQGGFAALTNFREKQSNATQNTAHHSRGRLVEGFLNSQHAPLRYLEQVALRANEYQGFNLLVGNAQQIAYYSNKSNQSPRLLPSGTYGLSNALLCEHSLPNNGHIAISSWPKVLTAMQAMEKLRNTLATPSFDDEKLQKKLLSMLQNTQQVGDHLLPNTGIPHEWEQLLSSQFIINSTYGTRCSTALTLNKKGQFRHSEISFDKTGTNVHY